MPDQLTRLRVRWENAWRMLPYLARAERIYRAVTHTIDLGIIDRYAREHAETLAKLRSGKFARARWHLRVNIVRALRLGLDRAPPGRILDLGAGAGYFLAVCRHFGHDVTGLDIPGNRMYDALFSFLRIPRFVQRIRPMTPLELDGAPPFDLITAFAVTFDRSPPPNSSDRWSIGEWQFLLQNLRTHLSSGGRLFLALNIKGNLSSRPELKEAFATARGFDTRFPGPREVLARRRETPVRS